MIYFCVGCGDADAWSLLESLTRSGSIFNMFLFINGNSNILCIDMIITKFQFYAVYAASSLFDTITLKSNITRDIIAEFVSCVAHFEILTINWKVSERNSERSKSLIFRIISLLEDYNCFSSITSKIIWPIASWDLFFTIPLPFLDTLQVDFF